jgi:hypothetical protein
MNANGKPGPEELAPFYHRYIDSCPWTDLEQGLEGSWAAFHALLMTVPPEKEGFRYAPGKWTVKQVVQHVIDTERVMAYRALRFARNDASALPGFEEDDWAAQATAETRTIPDLIAEAAAQRKSSQLLFASFDAAMLLRSGLANNAPCTTRATGWIIIGHMLHHARILNERYLTHAQP